MLLAHARPRRRCPRSCDDRRLRGRTGRARCIAHAICRAGRATENLQPRDTGFVRGSERQRRARGQARSRPRLARRPATSSYGLVVLLARQRRPRLMRVLPTLVEDLLDIVGRPYDGVDDVVLDGVAALLAAAELTGRSGRDLTSAGRTD